MSAKIEVLHKGGATACLTAAAQRIPNEEKVLVLFYNKDGNSELMSANLDHAQGLWLIELIKQKMLEGRV